MPTPDSVSKGECQTMLSFRLIVSQIFRQQLLRYINIYCLVGLVNPADFQTRRSGGVPSATLAKIVALEYI